MPGCAMKHGEAEHSLSCDFRSKASMKEVADRRAQKKQKTAARLARRAERNSGKRR